MNPAMCMMQFYGLLIQNTLLAAGAVVDGLCLDSVEGPGMT